MTTENPKPRPLRLLALALSLVVFGCQEGASAGRGTGGGAADAVRAGFKANTLDGKKLGPLDFPGKVVVVDFWATWCGPCHIQAKILEPLHRELHGRGVQFLAANVGEDLGTVREFVKERPFPYPVLVDPDDRLMAELGIIALPTLLVVDKKGKVAYFEPGLIDADRLRKVIKEAGA
jgi:thiol-disulfide isomerase/thioredoxin